jgi:hypothetical protein
LGTEGEKKFVFEDVNIYKSAGEENNAGRKGDSTLKFPLGKESP